MKNLFCLLIIGVGCQSLHYPPQYDKEGHLWFVCDDFHRTGIDYGKAYVQYKPDSMVPCYNIYTKDGKLIEKGRFQPGMRLDSVMRCDLHKYNMEAKVEAYTRYDRNDRVELVKIFGDTTREYRYMIPGEAAICNLAVEAGSSIRYCSSFLDSTAYFDLSGHFIGYIVNRKKTDLIRGASE